MTQDDQVILSQKILFKFNGELMVNLKEADYSCRSDETQKTLDVIKAAVEKGCNSLSYSIGLLCLEIT